MYMRAVHMHLDELIASSEERLVGRPARLRHDVVEDRIADPSGRRDDDRTQRGVRVGYVPEEGGVERGVEARESLVNIQSQNVLLA